MSNHTASTVDLSNWRFEFDGSPSILIGTPNYKAPRLVPCATPLDVLLHLAADHQHDGAIQTAVHERLHEEPTATAWHKCRTKFRNAPHFSKYRQGKYYERYHNAAIASWNGTATDEQQGMVDGLNGEISTSKIEVPAGQLLFHGCADEELHGSSNYPSFISTSLDPVVALCHATTFAHKRASKAIIYLLAAKNSLPAMWGNGGNLEEWELLLQTGLSCTFVRKHVGQRFDVIEADLSA